MTRKRSTGKQLSLFSKPKHKKNTPVGTAKKRVRRIKAKSNLAIKKRITSELNRTVKRINKVIDKQAKVVRRQTKRKCAIKRKK
jgi:hypothetical protein